jgi:phytoene dehydrogenase-like protein
MGKKVIVIGAGIAGLSAGCYAQMNGYDSTIYEMHTLPGGLCTAWERSGYTFDGCLDWFTGSAADGMFYELWQEVGAVQNTRFLYNEEYCCYVTGGKQTITLYTDPVLLEKELKTASPQDGELIEELCYMIRTFKGFKPPVSKAMETMGPFGYMGMMPSMLKNMKAYIQFFRYGKVSMEDFADRFKSRTLREMLVSIWGGNIPLSLFAATMAWCSNKTAGFPEGGSLKIAKGIERRYMGLGGRIHYKSRVEGIIVESGKAVGVRFSDVSRADADIVISASDGYTTIYNMLEGKYVSDTICEWYENMPTFPPYIQISLGVKRDMRGDARTYSIQLDEPLTIAGKETRYMIMHNFSFDKTQAPVGKASLAVRFFSDIDYWQELHQDKKRYKTEKDALAKAVIAKLEGQFPGITEQVEVIDVATPMTYIRYTNTWKGATMSWLPTTGNFGKSLPKTLPGLENFYLVGQWIVPGGGVPNALKTARDAVQIICRKDRQKFVTTKPE